MTGSLAILVFVLPWGLELRADDRRPLATDRPDTTESAYSVPSGVVQFEASLVDWSREGQWHTWAIAPFNLKYGLDPTSDLQLVVTPHEVTRTRGRTIASGTPDLALRWKRNLWGNDGGRSALAVMPWLSFPIGDNEVSADRLEGGLIIPYARELSENVGFGLMVESDARWNGARDRYGVEFVHTATIALALTADWGVFFEYAGIAPHDLDRGYSASGNAGVTLGVGPDTQFDAGLRVALNDAADDLSLFLGFSVRH